MVRDHHGTHYPVYCHIDGNFATSWQFLEDQLKENFEPNLVSLSTFLQRGILKKNNFALFDVHSLGAGEKFYMLTEWLSDAGLGFCKVRDTSERTFHV